jgi:hypothetical protein
MDTYIEQQTMGAVVSDRQKVLAAISFLDTSPRCSYNTKVKRDGEFLTYDTFKEWMTAFYATPNVANNARMKYENCKQREGRRNCRILLPGSQKKLSTIWSTS